MIKTLKTLVQISAVLTLVSCGGGSGDRGTAGVSTAPLLGLWSADSLNGETIPEGLVYSGFENSAGTRVQYSLFSISDTENCYDVDILQKPITSIGGNRYVSTEGEVVFIDQQSNRMSFSVGEGTDTTTFGHVRAEGVSVQDVPVCTEGGFNAHTSSSHEQLTRAAQTRSL